MADEIINQAQQIDYYEGNTGRKIGDFCIGFLGLITFYTLLYSLTFFIFKLLQPVFFESSAMLIITIFVILPAIILLIPAIIIDKMFKRGRRYIAIGIITILVIAPLLFFGACFIALSHI